MKLFRNLCSSPEVLSVVHVPFGQERGGGVRRGLHFSKYHQAKKNEVNNFRGNKHQSVEYTRGFFFFEILSRNPP